MAVIQKTHKAVFKGVEDQEELQKSLPEHLQKSKTASRCVKFFKKHTLNAVKFKTQNWPLNQLCFETFGYFIVTGKSMCKEKRKGA